MKRSRLISAVLLGLVSVIVSAIVYGSSPEALTQNNKLSSPVIDESIHYQSKTILVLGSEMAFIETGSGDPIIFVHGNPTSSYLWRNILPFVDKQGRAIAVDLIGMGKSAKPDIDYSFKDHFRYFSAFVDALGAEKITLVGHDWGAALVWHYARKNPGKVKQLAFMEGVLPPAFPAPSFESMGDEMGNMFRAFKDPDKGKELVIENNIFIEQILPGFIIRPLGEQAMRSYREPFEDISTRKPLLEWPSQIPIAGEPKGTQRALDKIEIFMKKTRLPVLLLYASPGVVVPPDAVPWYIDNIKNIETQFVGAGLHFIQEDQPEAIGRALNDWLRRVDKKANNPS